MLHATFLRSTVAHARIRSIDASAARHAPGVIAVYTGEDLAPLIVAGQVGIAGHLTIHDNVIVYAQSGVGGDVKEGSVISGSPAYDAREWLRTVTALPKLPELIKTVRELKKKMEQIEKKNEGGSPSDA